MKELFVLKEDLKKILNTLSTDSNIFYPTNKLTYRKYSEGVSQEDLDLDTIRMMTPLKAFYFRQIEKLEIPQEPPQKQNIILGVKQCDLKARKILDRVFLEGVEIDPFYKIQYDNTVIFSSDCPKPKDNCFCSYIYGTPYPEDGFDLNFSPVENGYIVEVGSEKGERILGKISTYLSDVTLEQKEKKRNIRECALKQLDEINKEFIHIKNINYEKTLEETFLLEKWEELSNNCVQCTGCNMICPSCYCFYIVDTEDLRARYWDACHFTSYARVAGGLNPREKVYERFRNRYECKLNWRMKNFNMYACTGCGRCFSACPGKIDIRQVLSRLVG